MSSGPIRVTIGWIAPIIIMILLSSSIPIGTESVNKTRGSFSSGIYESSTRTAGTNDILLEIDVEWSVMLQQGKGFVHLDDGATVHGPQGELDQYLPVEIEIPTTILSCDVKFLDPFDVHVGAVPSLVPPVIGDSGIEVHPEWKGSLLMDSIHDWRIVHIGERRSDDKLVQVYSLRIDPLDISMDGLTRVYRTLEITYSLAPEIWSGSSSAEVYHPKPLGDVKYLIITDEDSEDAVVPLAKWKSQKGLFTRIATVQDINAKYSEKDIQADIRAYIQDMEKEYDLDYVLLVGDVNKVKTRNSQNLHPYTTYGEPSHFASDSYYSCVSPNTSWNSDGDGYYAEAGELDDVLPDLAIGRFASNSPQLISSWIRTLVEREKNFTWNSDMETAIFIAGDPQNVPGYPPDTLDHFWDTYGSEVFDDHETIYYDGSGTLPFSSTSYRNTIGNNHQAACYFSHGTQTGLPGLFSNNQVSSLSNNGPEGSFFTMACLTGYFDSGSTESFGEAMTESSDRGVLGYMGSSRLAVGAIDTTYSGDAPGLEEDYWRGVREAARGNISSTVGDIYRYAVDHFSTSFAPFSTTSYGYSAQRTFLEYNLLGEPEAPLFFHEPDRMNLEFTLSPDNTTVWAKVTNETGAPIEGATVSLFRYLELGVAGKTNSTGEVTIFVPRSNGGRVNITASKSGELPTNSSLVLPDDLAPIPLYSIYPEKPDGFFDTYVTKPSIRLFSDEEGFVEYRIDGGEIFRNYSHVDLTGEEGYHYISFMYEDLKGQTSDWMTFNFTVDTTDPILWVDTDPFEPDGIGGWFNTEPIITLNSSEELSIAYYRIDNGVESLYEGPLRALDGVTRITFRGFDLAGNMNITDITISVDTILPHSTMNVSHSPDGDNSYYVTVPAILLKASDPNGATVQYRWDNGSWKNYENALYPPKGIHRLEYRAMDLTGNMEEMIKFEWFRYDPDPPTLNWSVDPAEPDGNNGYYITKPMIDLSSGPSEISGVMIRFYLGSPDHGFSWNEDSLPYNGPVLVPEGKWRFHMMIKDDAGNQYFPMPIDINVDLTRPDIDWNITPTEPDGANMWYVTPPVLTITNLSEGTTAFFRLDDNLTWMEIDEGVELPSGLHTVYVMASDMAGNTVYGGEIDYRYDDHDPVSVLGIERFIYFPNERINLTGASSTDESGPLEYMFNTSEDTGSLWMKTPLWDISFNRTGNFTITLLVKDISGRINTSRTVTITIIERPAPEPAKNDDLIIEPHDPDPLSEKGWTDAGIEEKSFIRGGIVLILILVMTILLILVIRKVRIKEVDWEDDDDWMNEDWVDLDLDEVPVEEDEVLIFE